MTPHRRPAHPDAPSGHGPAVPTIEDPLAFLARSHELVRRSLALLVQVCEQVEAGRVDDAVQRAAADVLRTFDVAAPLHHEDEEQHIFPPLVAHCHDAQVRAAIVKLQEDHLWMEAKWARLRTPLAALATGHAEGCRPEHTELARAFAGLYGTHVDMEDELVLPAAIAMLDPPTLHAMAAEMSRRRRAHARRG